MDNAKVYEVIKEDWMCWAKRTNAQNMVIGISGGKDSTVVATLAAKIFGPERVIGVMMPRGEQSDIDYSIEVCKNLGIENYTINIEKSVDSFVEQISLNGILMSDDTIINLPARLRMATLFGVAQSRNGRVINTCNASEDTVGYATLFGDNAGTYSPLMELTVTEIIELGRWLGIPEKFLVKPPSDGLCGQTDEDKLGFTYAALDNYIRNNVVDKDIKEKIDRLYAINKFKLEIVQLPHPQIETIFDLQNHVRNNYI